VLNPNATRELIAFFEDEILAYLAGLPRRLANPVTPNAYTSRREKAAERHKAATER
jgi:hypothetical protein